MVQLRLLARHRVPSVSGALAASGDVTSSTVSTPPSWTDPSAVQPGWVYQASYAVGVPMTLDVGQAANSPNPNGYSYKLFRGSTQIQTGSNVSGLTYTPVSADQYQQLSVELTATNAAGSATTQTASVTIT